MKEPPLHPREPERLRSLDESRLAVTPAEQRFDVVIETARRVFDVPIALFSLVTAETQCFKSASGLAVPSTPRAISFCGHTILTPDLFVVEDTLKDPRFADNPLVVAEPCIRFYAGCPIYGLHDLPLGTLCIIDTRPRHLDVFERKQLRALGQWLTGEVRNRGLSEQELLQLNVGDESIARLIDGVPKCWNRTAAEMLIAYALDTATEQQRIAALALEFMPAEGSVAAGFGDELQAARAWAGNLLRRLVPAGTVLATLDDTHFLMIVPDQGASTDEAVTGELLAGLADQHDPAQPLAWRGCMLTDIPHNGREKRDMIRHLQDALAGVTAGQIAIIRAPSPACPAGA